uniref:Ig-like domain-containing protein n=1 Tax=Poecilia formosa TaxID=48698 RepID=A0A087YG37_POEFO
SPEEMDLLFLLLLAAVLLEFVSADQNNTTIKAEPGENVILTCKDPDQGVIEIAEWKRTDLGTEYVLLYKDNQLDPDAQHPSYRDRVDLLCNQLRKGDVSLILKDTTTNDSGTYECRIDTEKHVGELISTISLQVSPPPPDEPKVTAKPGQDVILPCRSAENKPVIAVEWRRPDLGSQYVLLYRDEQLDPENQHPSYQNRVNLQDRQMKDGDVSLVLKDVATNDTGRYECRVQNEGSLDTKLISTVQLEVLPPDQKNFTAEPGATVILPCRTSDQKPIAAVDWTRRDLGKKYILSFRDGQFDFEDQHPSYKNRVALHDGHMKDGDVSLVLKNLTTNDNGTYECLVQNEGSGDRKLISTINLQVVSPGECLSIKQVLVLKMIKCYKSYKWIKYRV